MRHLVPTDTDLSVCFVITQGHWGGAQRYVFDLATHLAKEASVTVGVGTPDGPRDLQDRLALFQNSNPTARLTVVQLTHLRRPIAPLHDLRAIGELRRLARTSGAHVFHFNSAKAVVIGSVALSGMRTKRIATIHGWTSLEPISPARAWLYRTLERISVRALDGIIVPDRVSEHIATQRYHALPEKLAYIPHEITPPIFLSREQARARLPGTQARVIGTIANLYKTKNLPLLIESFNLLARTDADLRCIIIGEGSQRTTIQKLLEQSPYRERLFLMGAVPDAATLLPGFDVFCLPSTKEGYPYVVLEARAAGIAIVATTVGGVSDMLAQYPNSSCLKQPDAYAFAQAITAHLRNPSAPATTPMAEDHFTHMYEATRARYRLLLQ